MAFKIWQIGLHLQQQEALRLRSCGTQKNAFCNAGGGCLGARHYQRWADC